jgi:hypothetical protein
MLEKDSRRSEFPLVVTHVTRNDIILGFLAHAQKLKQDGQPFGGALVCYIVYFFISLLCCYMLKVYTTASMVTTGNEAYIAMISQLSFWCQFSICNM